MPSDEQRAAEAADKIEQQKQLYLHSVTSLNSSIDANDPPKAQIQHVQELHQQATAFFNVVDAAISKSELLGAHRSEHWAHDLAATAVNTLDNIPQLYERIWAESDRLGLKRPLPSPNSFYAMQSSVTVYNSDQLAQLRQRFEAAGLPIRGFTHPAQMNTRYANWEKIFMGGTAVAFLLIMLAIGIWVREYNNVSILIFRTVLALVAAAFGAVFIPGLLNVKTAFVRASGAAALFAIVFFFNPPALVRNVVLPDQPKVAPSPQQVP